MPYKLNKLLLLLVVFLRGTKHTHAHYVLGMIVGIMSPSSGVKLKDYNKESKYKPDKSLNNTMRRECFANVLVNFRSFTDRI